MKIICNGEERQIDQPMTILAFIQGLGVSPETAVVEYNGRILEKSEHHSQILEEGARLEVIRFVGGG